MPDNHQRILQEQPVIQLSSNEARHLVFMFHEMCDYYEALSNKNDDGNALLLFQSFHYIFFRYSIVFLLMASAILI